MEGYMALGIIAGVTAGALFWVSLIIWTYRDIRDRTRDLAMQILSVFLVMGFSLIGLLLYLIIRPRETLDEAYARSLEEEALLREIGEDAYCPSCRRFTEKDFMYCPYCQTQLRAPCTSCEEPLSFNWTACPKCGVSRLAASARTRAQTTPAPSAREEVESISQANRSRRRRSKGATTTGVDAEDAGTPGGTAELPNYQR